MSRYRIPAAAMGLALAASALTLAPVARANPSLGPPDESAPAATPATPLNVRPTKPLALLEESPHASVEWKLGAMLLIGGVCAWVWKTRGAARLPAGTPSLRILRRTSIGVRSELLVVEMDGQRLLLGVTPSSVQNLYIAPFEDDAETPVRELVEPSPSPRAARERLSQRPSMTKVIVADTSGRQRAEPVEGQALGLRALVERR